MIKTEKLLGKIKELEELEKRLLPFLNKHISSSLFLSDLKEADKKTLYERFQNMATTQKRHIEILNKITDEIKKKNSDVY